MRYLLLIHHNEEIFNKMAEGKRKEMLAESIQLCHQLHVNGHYIHASPLWPEAARTIVQVRNSKAIITDGPFMETKEQLAGYFLVDARNQEEAIEIAKQIPGARIGTVEVRPVIEVSGLPNE